MKIGAWETKKDFEKNEFSSQNNISGIDLEIFVTEESMSICGKNIDYLFEIYDYDSYQKMADAYLNRLKWILELHKKGQLEKEIKRIKKENNLWLIKTIIFIGTAILIVIYLLLI